MLPDVTRNGRKERWLTHQAQTVGQPRIAGDVIIGELIRNMDLGRFEMAYTVLLPCVFTVYLNPDDYSALAGIFPHIIDDAKRALRGRVLELNSGRTFLVLPRRGKVKKEYKIACRDWDIDFLSDSEVPAGDVEIHSELNETVQPGYCGTKTALIGREPSATAQRSTRRTDGQASSDSVFAD